MLRVYNKTDVVYSGLKSAIKYTFKYEWYLILQAICLSSHRWFHDDYGAKLIQKIEILVKMRNIWLENSIKYLTFVMVEVESYSYMDRDLIIIRYTPELTLIHMYDRRRDCQQ